MAATTAVATPASHRDMHPSMFVVAKSPSSLWCPRLSQKPWYCHHCVAHSIDEPPVFSTCTKPMCAVAPSTTAHVCGQHSERFPHQWSLQNGTLTDPPT